MTRERERFDALLAGRCEGPPAWLPLIDQLAARLSGVAYRDLSADPGLWASGATRAGELLQADALVVGCDFTLTAEACEAGPDADPLLALRQDALIETVRRLGATARTRCGLVAALVGPATLAQQLFAALSPEEGLRRVKSAHAQLLEALLKGRPDLLLFMERWGEEAPDLGRARQRAYGTLRNLAAHYDVPAALYVEDWTESRIAEIAALRLPFYLLGRGAGDALTAARTLAAAPAGVGVSVPEDSGNEVRFLADEVRAARAGGLNLFLTTSAAGGGDPAALRALALRLHGEA